MAYWINIKGFIDALAVFVKESCNQLANVAATNASIVQKESDPLWVQDFPVALHLSLQCWRRKGNDSNDLELLTIEHVRCSPAWQGWKEWRRDYVWVQEHNPSCKSVLEGKQVGQIQA